MPRPINFDLPSLKEEVVRKIAEGGGTFDDLVKAFPDPAEAYVCCPVQLTVRQMARLYAEEADEEDRHRVLTRIRERMRDERWVEKRAMHQAQRHSAKRDSILEAEAQVWAVLGLEFHSKRIRSLWERWEMLDGHTMDCLERLERGDGAYTTNLRDAMKELRDVEKELAELMPKLGIPERAMQRWNDKSGSRADLIRQAAHALESVEGNDQAGEVFNLLDYIEGTGEEGGA